MECPKCGAVNETDVGSCLSCGASMPEADESLPTRMQQQKIAPPKPAPRLATSNVPPKQCPSCNTLNAATFKFCARCGAALNATAVPTAGKPANKAPTPAPYAAAPPAAPPAAPAAVPPAKAPAKAPPADARPPTMFAAAGSIPELADLQAARAAAAKAAARPAPAAVPPPKPASPAVAPAAAAAKPAPAAPAAARPAPAAAPAAPRPAPAAAAPARPPAPPAARPPPPGARPAAAKPPPPAARPAPARARARVSAIARDGSRSADFLLTRDETRVGRAVAGDEVKLDKDPFIAPLHAVFRFEGEQLMVQDSGTANGVFLWLKQRDLSPGDELRVGRQRLRIEWLPEEPETIADQPLWGSPDPGYAARAVQLLEGGGEGDIFPLKAGDNLVGRGTGDVSFPHDGYVSSRHATITVADGVLSVKDMGSANGTFVRIAGAVAVATGDLLLVGEQILRIDPA